MADKRKRKRLPPLPPGAPGKPGEPRYREQYGVIIICRDEAAQRAIFAGLQGLHATKLKVVVT